MIYLMDRNRLEILGHIRRATGKTYPKLEAALHAMSDDAAREFARMLGDLRYEQDKAINNTRMYPFRR